MLTYTAKPKFLRPLAAVLLLACAAWFSSATLAQAQNDKQQEQRSDSSIQSDVAAVFQHDSTLQGQHISAKVANGVVTLSGTVQTEAQSYQAETDASNVAGVSGILNQLKVKNPGNANSQSGLAAQNSANQLNPDDQQAAQAQPQDQNSVPPPPPDEIQPRQPQQQSEQAERSEQSEQPYDDYGAPPPNQQGYGEQPYGAEPYAGQPPAPQPTPYYPTPVAPVTIPAGRLLRVRLSEPLDTAHLQDGAIFQATAAVDVYQDGVLAIPRGATLTGHVVEVEQGGKGKLGGSTVLRLQLTNVNLGGKIFPLTTDVWSSKGPNKAGYTAGNTAGGAILGAIIGGIIGRGAGAAIGAGVGAAGGLAASSATNGPRIHLPVESQVDFHLAVPATVQPVSWREAQRLASSAPQPQPPVLVRRPRRPVYVAPPPPPPPGYYAPYPYPY